jgi:putative peptide modification system cyclase
VVIGDVVNATRDEMLDATLATTFRIGMEQSRFVNIVPEGQARQALLRMQRDSATRIDREIGSEIALREQARAVILPTVTQYGQKFRLTAELIDPNGARTVFIKTADADKPVDLLPALDKLVRGVRAGLGESLSQIQASHPLEQVTTANLQALRAYSHARRVAQEGNIEQALGLLSYATDLDPNFASAHAFKGSLFFTQQRYADAHTALDKALSVNGRLTDRERLYIRAQVARFADPRTMAEQWRIYADFYRDQGTGQNNLGNVRYIFLLDYPGAEVALSEAAATRAPMRNFSMQTLGHVLLAQEKLEEAERQFRAADALSPAVELFGLSDVLVVSGRFDEAERYLDETRRQTPIVGVERAMRRATLLIAQGELAAASAAIASVLPQVADLPTPNPRWRATAALIALHASRGDMVAARSLAMRHMADLLSAEAQRSVASLETMEHLLYAASWAARLGLPREARQALTLARQRGELDRFPVRARLAELVEGEMELAAGRPRPAADRPGRTSKGVELWELHELRARALRALGDKGEERTELRWLTTHSGLAHAQWIDQLLGQQARAVALRDAKRQLSEQDGRQ